MTDAPDTVTVADALEVPADRLREFVAREPEPTASAVLGWALAHPRHADTVAAWLQARRKERRPPSAVADGGPDTAGGDPDAGQPETPAWVDDTAGLIREDLSPETPPAGKCRNCIDVPARAVYQTVTVPHTSAWFQLLERHDLAHVGREPQQFGDGSRWLYINSAGLGLEVDGDVTEPGDPYASYVTARGPADSVAGFVRDLLDLADWIKRELCAPAPKPAADAAKADSRAVPDDERLVERDRAAAVVRRLPATDDTERDTVPDGGSLAALSGAGDRTDTPDAAPDHDTGDTDGDTPGGPGDLDDDHDTDPGTDDRASDTPPDTPDLHDEEGHLVDGHGRRLYETREATARLHHEAVAAGWRHSYALSPFQNLRAVVELVEADRRGYERLAFRFILGYGPGSTPQALERLGVTT
jgi:hypothetical protein